MLQQWAQALTHVATVHQSNTARVGIFNQVCGCCVLLPSTSIPITPAWYALDEVFKYMYGILRIINTWAIPYTSTLNMGVAYNTSWA